MHFDNDNDKNKIILKFDMLNKIKKTRLKIMVMTIPITKFRKMVRILV